MPPIHWQMHRLELQDYILFRSIKKLEGLRVRADALDRLIPLVEQMEFPVVRTGGFQLKIGIPEKLDAALKKRSASTGLDQRALLILAAREYKRRVQQADKEIQ